MPCLATVLLSLAGCAMQDINDQNVDQMIVDFKSGDITLSNSIVSAGNDGFFADQMVAMYDAGNWAGLAKLVIRANSANDLSWFLLGRSAEGIGYYQAAAIYYEDSINAEVKLCNPRLSYLASLCRGLQLPAYASARLSALPQE